MRRGRLQTIARGAVSDAPLRSSRAERAVRELLARRTAVNGEPVRWHTRNLRTGHHVIAFVCRPDHGDEILVRVAWSEIGADALEQERDALSALEHIAGLERWRTLVPRIIEDGAVGGLPYLVETVMPGIDGRRFEGVEHKAAMEATARAIVPLYSATARTLLTREVSVPSGDLVHAPLARLRGACGDAARDPLKRLGERLESALVEQRLSCSRVHGDLWLGNAMLSADGSTVTGLVDWASSCATGLPAVDLTHMLVSSRAIAGRRDTGTVTRRLLDASEPLRPFERELLVRHGTDAADLLHTDDLVLLAWLQHIAHVLSASKVWIPRLWLKRNVNPVLATL